MIVRILIYIKHHFAYLWFFIEKVNMILFSILFRKKLESIILKVLKEYELQGYTFRQISKSDLKLLHLLITSQSGTRLDYFKPHKFDIKSLQKIQRNPSFLMMGVYKGSSLVGYFFLRFFWNRKCFVGRLIDEPYEGKGIGRIMNKIMYNIGWKLGFRVLSTISKNNHLVMKSHANNQTMIILKELDNDYLLVEFLENKQKSI